MATYTGLFDALGLRDWCDSEKKPSLLSLRSLRGEEAAWYEFPFPSLDNLHSACNAVPFGPVKNNRSDRKSDRL